MDDVVIYGCYNIFTTSGKYHQAIWTSSHVVMACHKCGLRLEHELLLYSYLPCFSVVMAKHEMKLLPSFDHCGGHV